MLFENYLKIEVKFENWSFEDFNLEKNQSFKNYLKIEVLKIKLENSSFED